LNVNINSPVTTAGLTAQIRNKTPYLTGLLAFFKGVFWITLFRKIQKINPKTYMMSRV
jgi:hypothetical protein